MTQQEFDELKVGDTVWTVRAAVDEKGVSTVRRMLAKGTVDRIDRGTNRLTPTGNVIIVDAETKFVGTTFITEEAAALDCVRRCQIEIDELIALQAELKTIAKGKP